MSANIISFELDFSKWDNNTYRWSLPNPAIIKDVKRLWINATELPKRSFRINNGFLELLDRSIKITPSDRVIAEIVIADINKKVNSGRPFSQNLILALIAILPALLTFFATIRFNSITPEMKEISTGPPLSEFENYPVVMDRNEKSFHLDHEKFMMNVERFIREDNYNAGTNLIQLGQSNNILLTADERCKYEQLINKYHDARFDNLKQYRNELFKNPTKIIEVMGKMFANSKIEFVLHDAQDPIHSVKAIVNSMTGREVGSPASVFGNDLAKHYSETFLDTRPLISYKLKFVNRTFKSSSIPLYDSRFGLFGYICINFDVTDISVNPDKEYIKKLVEGMSRIEQPNIKKQLERRSPPPGVEI